MAPQALRIALPAPREVGVRARDYFTFADVLAIFI
jgi:hypothetical protein